MNRKQALSLLSSGRVSERLRAARHLARIAKAEDHDELRQALDREEVRWIRIALQAGVERALGGRQDEIQEREFVAPGDEDSRAVEAAYSQGVQNTAAMMLHELEPLVGLARMHARDEVGNFTASATKRQLDRLKTVLDVFDKLRQAASAPMMVEFDLSAALRGAAEGIAASEARVEFSGPTPHSVVGDVGLIELAFVNGLRNAVEATEASSRPPAERRVTVSWDESDTEYWVVVIDRGVGLPAGTDKLIEAGATTKPNHHGMGLQLARRAMASHMGTLTLAPRVDGGTSFEIRWPKA